METNEIFKDALSKKFVLIDEQELKPVLEKSEIIRTEDTHLSDLIRLLRFDDNLFIQEITFKKEILIRKMNSMEEADHFIKERLDYYERKWDGCGCKINYYE